jgi:hypothetical protein
MMQNTTDFASGEEEEYPQSNLRKQLLAQQLRFGRLEHARRMRWAEAEHKEVVFEMKKNILVINSTKTERFKIFQFHQKNINF